MRRTKVFTLTESITAISIQRSTGQRGSKHTLKVGTLIARLEQSNASDDDIENEAWTFDASDDGGQSWHRQLGYGKLPMEQACFFSYRAYSDGVRLTVAANPEQVLAAARAAALLTPTAEVVITRTGDEGGQCMMLPLKRLEELLGEDFEIDGAIDQHGTIDE